MKSIEAEIGESLRGAAADVLYSNGVLDLAALSRWLDGREAEQRKRAEEARALAEENAGLRRQAEENGPLARRARQALETRRAQAARSLRALSAAAAPLPELERLAAELAQAREPEAVERLAERVARLFEDAFPTRPTAEAVGLPGEPPAPDLAAFQMPEGTRRGNR